MHRNSQSKEIQILLVMDKLSIVLLLLLFALLINQSYGATDNEYDFYRASCPSAEETIRSTVRELHRTSNGALGPQLLRLAFHDCFVMGCDASILLDSEEKDVPPNLSVKGFDEIDAIKSRVEQDCPGVVSCADIVALAAREAVLLAGGMFYPVFSGRTDSKVSFPDIAAAEIPNPGMNVSEALKAFAAKGFNAQETVALLGGGHSTGRINCAFISHRLFNFNHTNEPDPSMDPEFAEALRSQCGPPVPSLQENSIPMDYEGAGNGFGEVYFRSLMQRKGLLVVDQQLMAGEDTKGLVEAYASDVPHFQSDFALAMFKLTHLRASHEGEVRRHCRRVNGEEQ